MSTSIQSLTPYLIVKNAREAIAFYGRAFGAEELFRLTDHMTVGSATRSSSSAKTRS